MKKLNNDKKDGITLISLVVTIVVLLILAGVSISTLTGENGVVDNAKKTQNNTYYQIASEEVNQLVLEHKLTKKDETLEQFLASKVPSRIDGVTRKDDNTLIVKKNGYEIEVEVKAESKKLTLDVVPYVGTYDGQLHDMLTSVNVSPSDANIEYSIDNGKTYIENIPQIINASSVSVIVKASKIGYKTETVTKIAVVNKAEGTLTLSATSGTINYPNSTTFTVSGNTGTLSVSSSNTSVATVSIRGNRITVKSVGGGNATITVKSASTENYNEKIAIYSVNVNVSKFTGESGVGYYADTDGDGTVDGIIFADSTGTDQNEYYITEKNYAGLFGTKDVLSTNGNGKERFNVMKLYDYHPYGVKLESVLNLVRDATRDPWAMPTIDEWLKFKSAFGITSSNYSKYRLADTYWSSSRVVRNENGRYEGYSISFSQDITLYPSHEDYLQQYYVRLCRTF